MKIPYYIVDVFAKKRFTGNQLAVVLAPSQVTSEQMQEIAREMHFSETTFVGPTAALDNTYPVRIFTPEHEVPFAGHPVLGTAFVIREMIMKHPDNEIILDLQVGLVPVSYCLEIGKPSVFWMKQPEPTFGKTFEPAEVAQALSLPESSFNTRFPIQEVSTGLPFIIIPVKSREAVKAARINMDVYENLIATSEAKALYLFCNEPYDSENTLNARMFGPYYGVAEDPATGSAGGCLMAYLNKNRYISELPPVVMIEQGYEINRPSLIYGKVEENEEKIIVEIGGSVFLVAKGELVV